MKADPVTVTATVTPDGPLFSYNYTITDTLPGNDDAFLIDIRVPAVAGSIKNLTAPAGFNTAFDSGLGLVSFLENTSVFGPAPISGFSFESASGPVAGTFEASILSLDDFSISTEDGVTIAPGATTAPPTTPTVPEPGSLLLTATGAPLMELLRRLKARRKI